MPQIEDLGVFLKYLDNIGVSHIKMKIHPLHLKASQGNFDNKKIEALRDSDNFDPVIVANDLYVLDGHHRWLAQGYSESMEIVKVDLGIRELKKVAHWHVRSNV